MKLTDMTENASAGATGAGSIAGPATGFASGGIGTIKRAGVNATVTKQKRKRKMSETHVPGHLDHEVRMAHGELLNLAHNATELYKIMKDKGESEGLPGWVSSYITLANDYMESVVQYMREGEVEQATDTSHRF
jgi:N-acetylglucosamine-6-phosphate deacetylase